MSVVRLSRGSVWKPTPFEPPYLLADPGSPWPSGADAFIRFYDTQGTQIAEIEGDTTAAAIEFLADAAIVDIIPAGANFEVFVDTDDGLQQVRYGKVVRREAQFLNSPAISTTHQALQFIDTFPTLGLRSSWEAVAGVAQIYDNSGVSLPNGVGPRTELLAQERAAIRWYAPLGGNTVRVRVNLLNQSGIFGDDASKTTVVVCADQRFTSYLGVQFVDLGHKIHFCKGSGPFTVTYQGSEISNTVADGDSYEIYYDGSTDTIYVYKGADTTPLGSWTDDTHSVPHGPGYQYTGLAFDNTLLNPGIQVTYWTAKDDV